MPTQGAAAQAEEGFWAEVFLEDCLITATTTTEGHQMQAVEAGHHTRVVEVVDDLPTVRPNYKEQISLLKFYS